MSLGSMVDEKVGLFCADLTEMQMVEMKARLGEIEDGLKNELDETICKRVLRMKAEIKHGKKIESW